MARVRGVALEGVDEVTIVDGNLINRDVFAILNHRPEAAKALANAIDAVYSTGTLSPRLMELIRIRIAFHNQCRSCMAIRFSEAIDHGVDDNLVCSLEKPAEAPDLSEAERAALRYADLFATNHLAIDDAVYDDLRKYFDEGEIVELGLKCALCVGSGRLAATWHVVDHLPDRFKADGVVTPWGGSQLVVHETRDAHLEKVSARQSS
jgi:AhpD family alkylhydroperoxidase